MPAERRFTIVTPVLDARQLERSQAVARGQCFRGASSRPQRELQILKLAQKPLTTANKKAPRTFQFRTPRQPSPRTAKPQLDSRPPSSGCKRHFGNQPSFDK